MTETEGVTAPATEELGVSTPATHSEQVTAGAEGAATSTENQGGESQPNQDIEDILNKPERLNGYQRQKRKAERAANLYIEERARREDCLLYTSPSPRDKRQSRMPSSA